MKQALEDIVKNTNPKSISTVVKQHRELYDWIQTAKGATISEKIYNILNPELEVCVLGNNKRFKSLTLGYGFCGPASKCKCAAESVSTKVSKSKKSYTKEQKADISQKRASTNLKKYGVSNVGQTATAIEHRAAVYADKSAVKEIVEQVKQTKLVKYGNEHYNNSNSIKETYKLKRTSGYWINRFPDKNIAALENKAQLESLYLEKTPLEIADQLGVHIQTVYKYLNAHGLREPFKSNDELELVRYLESLGITNIIRNTRKLLPSKREIDIYLPDYKVAIEYNGVYWHHEDVAHITRTYHYEKFQECQQLGIQLITVFSNFWHNKRDIVKSTIAAKLGKLTQRVYARNCKCVIVESAVARDFLNTYHIQGYTPAKITLGLEFNSQLVALMSFSDNRIGIGSRSTDTELVRFASSQLVIGGASKLLNYFRTHYSYNKIVSFSDNEWSTGHLYKTLGFSLEKSIKPSYWYLNSREHKLYHRFTFSKQKLVKQGHDPLLTESQITKSMGLLKIWDCGKQKWVLL
jgi:hypothetical protein